MKLTKVPIFIQMIANVVWLVVCLHALSNTLSMATFSYQIVFLSMMWVRLIAAIQKPPDGLFRCGRLFEFTFFLISHPFLNIDQPLKDTMVGFYALFIAFAWIQISLFDMNYEIRYL